MIVLDILASMLGEAGFCRSKVFEHRFFRQITELTALIVNLRKVDDGVQIVYGVSSTAFTKMAGSENALIDCGVDDSDCTLREKAVIQDINCKDAAGCIVKAFFDTYMHLEKDALLDAAKEKRKQFINRIAVRLKPLGFKKKGNKWYRRIGDTFELTFEAQKSGFSDEYYFNVVLRSDMNTRIFPCYYERVMFNDEAMFDWQLLSDHEITALIDAAVNDHLMPLINSDEIKLIETSRSKRFYAAGGDCAECMAKLEVTG